MYNTQRSVDECRMQKVGDNMTTTKTRNVSLSTFDEKKDFMYIILKVILMMRIYIYSKEI